MTTRRWLKLATLIGGVALCLVALLNALKMGSLKPNALKASPADLSISPLSPGKPQGDSWPSQLKFTSPEGKTLALAELPAAQVYLLNFWASWCEACMEEMPSLVQLHEAYRKQGFEVLSVNLDDDSATAIADLTRQFHPAFPLFTDPNSTLADRFNVNAIPLTVVFTPTGKVLYSLSGSLNWNSPEFRTQLEGWLKSPPTLPTPHP